MTSFTHVNRCMIADLPGPEIDAEWSQHLEKHQFGGICLFRRNIVNAAQLRRLVTDIRALLGEDAWIAVDQEGGAVLRVLDVPLVPSPMAIGATGDETLSHQLGAVAARGLLHYGINWNYAPTLDVNNNPLNPVIGERSFGSNPRQVAQLGVAWARGLESAGVMSAVKHFPGHGDTSVDSHLALPVVNKDISELEACEWLPFRAAVRAGAASIMTAHILYPSLDADHPATLSKAILTGLLRDQWGYDGIVVTDATDMQAIAARHPNGEGAALALIAGADAILACTHGDIAAQTRQVEAVGRALQDGRLSLQRVNEALARLSRASRRFPGTPRPYREGEREQDEHTALEAARRGVTSVGLLTRPRTDDHVLLIVPVVTDVGGPYGDSLRGEELVKALAPAFPKLRALVYDPAHPSGVEHQLLERQCDFVLFATTSRWALTNEEMALAHQASTRGVPALHLALWNPYHVAALGMPALVTYGFREHSLTALRECLLGARASGRLPVKLEGAEPVRQ